MATSCSLKNILEVHFVAEQNKEIVVINEKDLMNKLKEIMKNLMMILCSN